MWAEAANPLWEHNRTIITPNYPSEACPHATPCQLDVQNEVLLFYWPQNLTSRNICASNGYGTASTMPVTGLASTAVVEDIHFRGQDLQLLNCDRCKTVPRDSSPAEPSSLPGKWTFTSPTVYLAHRAMHATRTSLSVASGDPLLIYWHYLNSTIVSIAPATVVSLAASDLFSKRPSTQNFNAGDGVEYARLVAQGNYNPPLVQWIGENIYASELTSNRLTASFDFGQIQEPVPASAYFDARHEDCWGIQTHCGTITHGMYRPELYIRGDVFTSEMRKNSVAGGCTIPRLVDPPIALRPIPNQEQEPVHPNLPAPNAPASAPVAMVTGAGYDVAESQPNQPDFHSRETGKRWHGHNHYPSPPPAQPAGTVAPPFPEATAFQNKPSDRRDPYQRVDRPDESGSIKGNGTMEGSATDIYRARDAFKLLWSLILIALLGVY